MVMRIVYFLCAGVFINSFLFFSITNAHGLRSYVESNTTRIKRQTSNCNGFTCTTSNECIPQSQKCNGIPDCSDGSDESPNCGGTSIPCVLPRRPVSGDWFFAVNKNLNLQPGETVAVGTVLQFECYHGYKLSEGNAYTVCLEQGWNKNPPSCVRVCPALQLDENTKVLCFDKYGGDIKCSEATDGAYARFECAPFYESSDHRLRRYCVRGQWNLLPPQCLPVCGEKRVSAATLSVNGTIVERGNYPWTTALYEKDGDTEDFLFTCGGTMLTQRIIVTAAHCVTNIYGDAEPPDYFRIAVGKYFRDYGDSRDKLAQYSEIEIVIVHPRYRGDSQRHASDIALLITKEKLAFSRVVQPVCFRSLDLINLMPNEMGIVAGWGYTTANNNLSDALQEITVPYKDDATCRRELTSDWTDRYLTYDKFCAGYYNKSIAVCQGDSGSGLVFKHRDGRYYVHGIVSLTKTDKSGCDVEVSGLYTRVSSHYEWLELVVANYSFTSTREHTPDVDSNQRTSSSSCVLPDNPINGKWSIFNNRSQKLNPGQKINVNTRLNFECEPGYELNEENAYLICLQDGWSKKPPSCIRATCPNLLSDNTTTVSCFDGNMPIDCSKATNGSYAKYECTSHYVNSGVANTRHCLNGRWSSIGDQCVPVCGGKRQVFPDDGDNKNRWNYPWIAAIYKKHPDDTQFEYICVGTILSRKIIVSAAHCFTNNNGLLLSLQIDYKIGVGKYFKDYRNPLDIEAEYLDVQSIEVHYNYRAYQRQFAANIALLITRGTISFSNYVQPVCYQNVDKIVPTALGKVVGWTRDQTDAIPVNQLIEETFSSQDEETCKTEYPKEWLDEYYTYDKICVGGVKEKHNICNAGGSGSPLVFQNNGSYYIQGIFSNGQNLDNIICLTTLFTRFSDYYQWVTSIINQYP